jgi:stearoyl-CoA desaturase (delta-9 desaturase)
MASPAPSAPPLTPQRLPVPYAPVAPYVPVVPVAGDPTRPDADSPEPGRASLVQLSVTLLLVTLPLAGLVVGVVTLWGHGVSARDLALAAAFYLLSGFGVTVGFHRLLTHRSFVAVPWLRRALTLAGSLAFEGGAISWVATHRRHHARTDRPGDPHSPHAYGTSPMAMARGLAHAHVGWLFAAEQTSEKQYAPDLVADPFMRRTQRLFPLLCVVSLGAPLLAGYLLTFTVRGMLTALLWAGLVRICLFHHATWSVNSICHLMGRRRYRVLASDRSTDVWPLAVLTLGESWHNYHHADQRSARHGVRRRQIDLSATVIRLFERCGWVRDVRWPSAERISSRNMGNLPKATA